MPRPAASTFRIGGPAYSLTCRVELFHESNPSRVVRGLAILDNGSAVTLVNQELLRKLYIPRTSTTQIHLPLNTVDGPCGDPDLVSYNGMWIGPVRMPGEAWNVSC